MVVSLLLNLVNVLGSFLVVELAELRAPRRRFLVAVLRGEVEDLAFVAPESPR